MKAPRAEFTWLTGDLLRSGRSVRFQALGYSMQPEILHGDVVTVAPVVHTLTEREIVLCLTRGERPILHRIIESKVNASGQKLYLLRGDAHDAVDGWLEAEHILGRMVAVERRGAFKRPSPLSKAVRIAHRLRQCLRMRKRR